MGFMTWAGGLHSESRVKSQEQAKEAAVISGGCGRRRLPSSAFVVPQAGDPPTVGWDH